MTDTSISALEQQVRSFINRARKQRALLNTPAAWNQLCSSLDVVGDTEMAFDAYASAPDPKEAGATYLMVYGVLQALVLQQDAVYNLAEALGLKYELDPVLKEVREARNASIGHPTKRHGTPRSHFISRISMTKSGFQLMTVYPDRGPGEFKHVSIPSLLATQRAQLRSVLTDVVASLKQEEEAHKAMFKHESLAAVFPATSDYYFEKIFETISSGQIPEYGHMHVQLIRKAVDDFKAKLAERDLSGAFDSIEYHLGLVTYPLDELGVFFTNPARARLKAQDAYIFEEFVQSEFGRLRAMAEEVDEFYRSEGDA